MRRFHPGTFTAGVIFAALGIAFLTEALGAWSFALRDLRLILPVMVIIIGLSILISSLNRANRSQ